MFPFVRSGHRRDPDPGGASWYNYVLLTSSTRSLTLYQAITCVQRHTRMDGGKGCHSCCIVEWGVQLTSAGCMCLAGAWQSSARSVHVGQDALPG